MRELVKFDEGESTLVAALWKSSISLSPNSVFGIQCLRKRKKTGEGNELAWW